MKERKFDEMVAYFNRRVSEMGIAQDYKMELLGMVTALGYKHEKTTQWIPCSERLPGDDRPVLATLKWADDDYEVSVAEYWHNSTACHGWGNFEDNIIAWQPLPEPYKGEE